MESWKQGETVRLEAEFYNSAGELVDPVTHTVSVEYKDGTKVVSAEDMEKRVLGIWFYKWDIPVGSTPGDYHGEARLVKDDEVTIAECWFAVVDRIS